MKIINYNNSAMIKKNKIAAIPLQSPNKMTIKFPKKKNIQFNKYQKLKDQI